MNQPVETLCFTGLDSTLKELPIFYCTKEQKHLLDSRVLQLTLVTSNTISPVESEKQVSAGNRVTLSCRYTGSVNRLYWYRQYPSSKLDFLLYVFEDGSMSGDRPAGFSAKVQNKIVDLEIFSTAVSDSALYYCALCDCVLCVVLMAFLPLKDAYNCVPHTLNTHQ
uniref:Ig-like domain-containing protein n=1 Tax=Astyanax mexicanus TaxID=7994 RepID=A0A3B1JQG7_ASTMX